MFRKAIAFIVGLPGAYLDWIFEGSMRAEADWKAREARGEDPDPGGPGGPGKNAW